MSKNGNGGGDSAVLTLHLLRELRAKMATKDDLTKLATKSDLAKLATKDDLAKLATKDDLTKLKKDLEGRLDMIMRAIKDNYRVFAKRIRTVEIRVGARRPR